MTRTSEDGLIDRTVIRKLASQFGRTHQLLEFLTPVDSESELLVSPTQSPLRWKADFDAEQTVFRCVLLEGVPQYSDGTYTWVTDGS